MDLPPDLQRRLTESDQHLRAYLAVVPRRGADVVLHASARTAGELADRLEEIAGELRGSLPRDCISSAGYWFQAVDLPWVDYAFMETVPAAAAGTKETRDAAYAAGYAQAIDDAATRCEREMGNHYEMLARGRGIRALKPSAPAAPAVQPAKVKRPGRMVPCDPYQDGEQCSWCNGSGERWEDDPPGAPTADGPVVPIEGAAPEGRQV